MKTTKRAFSYIRFSDVKQAKGDSLRRQLEWGNGLCEAKGWMLDDSVKLQDLGVSAFRGENAATGHLSAFLEAIKLGKVKAGDVLMVESLDRLSRQDVDTGWEIFRGILKAGVEIVTREPERHYLPSELSDLGTRIGVQVFLERAYNESATKSMRGKAYWAGRRAKLGDGKKAAPIHLNPPAWLRLSKDRQRFEIIPEAAKAIKLIYRWAGEGLGLNPITARLNQEGIPPIARRDSWRRSYVAKLLSDKSVIGEYQPHVIKDGKRVPQGESVQGYFPAIISEKEWYKVRQCVAQRGRELGPKGVGIANLFTGLFRDAHDGQSMNMTYAHSSRKPNCRVLVSYGCRNGEPGSVHIPFPYDAIEREFLQAVRELKVEDITGGGRDPSEDEIAALSGKIAELDRKISTVQRRVIEEDDIEPLMTLLGKLSKERKTAAGRADRLKSEAAHRQPTVLMEVQSLADMLKEAEGDELMKLRTRIKARVKQLVSEIWVLAWDMTPTFRVAEVQIIFHTGKVRYLMLGWTRYGRGQGKVELAREWLCGPEVVEKMTCFDLRQYRTDPKVRQYFAQERAYVAKLVAEVKQVVDSGQRLTRERFAQIVRELQEEAREILDAKTRKRRRSKV